MADDQTAEGRSGVLGVGCALLAVLATLALLGAILGEPLASVLARVGVERVTTVRIALGVLGTLAWIGTCALAARASVQARLEPPRVRIPPPPTAGVAAILPDAAALTADRVAVERRYFNEAILLFGNMLLNPTYRLRLVESFTLHGDTARTHSTADFVMPPADRDQLATRGGSDPMRVAVPLLWLPKGTLLDGMVITNASGESLMKLARRDTVALIGLAVRSLFSAAFLGDAPADARTEAALEGIQRLVAIRDPVDAEEVAQAFEELVRGLEPVAFGPFGVLSALVRQSATEYVLAVEAPLQSGCALSIGYTGSVSIRTYRPGRGGPLGGLIGLEPSEIEIPLRAARLFDNYHAELDGRNRDQYVRSQRVVQRDRSHRTAAEPPRADGLFTEPANQNRARRSELRWHNDSGDGFPHLHLVNYGYLRHAPLLGWRVRLAEVPPGSLGPVVGLAFTVTLVALAFAVTAAKLTAPDLNAPAVVLAIPVLVITVFGFSFPRLLRSSLTVVLGFLASGVLAVLTALSLLTLREIDGTQEQAFVFAQPTLFGSKVHLLAALCGMAGAVLTFVLLTVLVARLAVYREHQRRNNAGRIE